MSELVLVKPQEIMVNHLRNVKDALLFCGMGLSKTASCLYRLNELFLSGESVAALVVAPLRVGTLTWPSEVRDWDQFNWMRVANLRTESGQRDFLYGRAHIYICNYESLHHLVSLVERRGGELPYDVVIFDELTQAKNPSSKRINFYRRKVPRAERQWGLTGTPLPNSNLDIFAQVRLIDGGQRLGTSYTAFKAQYFMQPAYMHAPWKEKQGTEEKIQRAISDITCTLKSSDWLDIPETIIEDVEIKFPEELLKQYQKLERDLVIELKEKTLNVSNAASLITKLIQFTSGCMYDDEKATHPIHDLKFCELEKIISKQKGSVFVATMYKHEYVRMKQHFPKSVFFNEAKTIEAQQRLMDDWNAGRIKVMFAHPASVGHGLNFQYGGSTLIYPSLTHNREWYEQLICRFARRGQKEITKVYRLMVPGTVDDAVAEALANKASNEARLISALQMLESYRSDARASAFHPAATTARDVCGA